MDFSLSSKIEKSLNESNGERVLFIERDGRKISVADFQKKSEIYEDFLLRRNVIPGEHLGIYAARSADFVAFTIAAIKVGAVVVPLDLHSTPARVQTVFEDAEVKKALVDFKESAEYLRREISGLEIFSFADIEPSESRGLKSNYSENREDPAYMAYTSGTTGRPKGVVLSRRAVDAYVSWFAQHVAAPSDVFLMALPFSTAVSLVDTFAVFYSGCTGLLSPEKHYKEPSEFVKHMALYGASILMLPAPVLHMLVSHGGLSSPNVPSLKKVLFGASAYPTDQLKVMRAALDRVKVTHLYGNTETGIVCSFPVPDKFNSDQELFLPAGRVCPQLKGKIERNIPGMNFAADEGEFWVSGPNLLTEYWKRPEQNEKKIVRESDGTVWYRTGDIARELTEGVYRLVGRIDRVFKKRGYQVEPEEVERQLGLLPEIAAIAVVPKKTKTDDVVSLAFIILKGDAKLSVLQLKKYCSEKVPAHMIPDKFIFVREFPKTTSGKVDYLKLADAEGEQG